MRRGTATVECRPGVDLSQGNLCDFAASTIVLKQANEGIILWLSEVWGAL